MQNMKTQLWLPDFMKIIDFAVLHEHTVEFLSCFSHYPLKDLHLLFNAVVVNHPVKGLCPPPTLQHPHSPAQTPFTGFSALMTVRIKRRAQKQEWWWASRGKIGDDGEKSQTKPKLGQGGTSKPWKLDSDRHKCVTLSSTVSIQRARWNRNITNSTPFPTWFEYGIWDTAAFCQSSSLQKLRNAKHSQNYRAADQSATCNASIPSIPNQGIGSQVLICPAFDPASCQRTWKGNREQPKYQGPPKWEMRWNSESLISARSSPDHYNHLWSQPIDENTLSLSVCVCVVLLFN